MTLIVMRILVDNLVAFGELKEKVTRHIVHEHSEEMREKSVLVSTCITHIPCKCLRIAEYFKG